MVSGLPNSLFPLRVFGLRSLQEENGEPCPWATVPWLGPNACIFRWLRMGTCAKVIHDGTTGLWAFTSMTDLSHSTNPGLLLRGVIRFAIFILYLPEKVVLKNKLVSNEFPSTSCPCSHFRSSDTGRFSNEKRIFRCLHTNNRPSAQNIWTSRLLFEQIIAHITP